MTPHERKLWYLFLRHYPTKIYKQRIIQNYIVDFYCHAAKLVIEVDGSQHFTEEGTEQDQKRDRMIERLGLHVIRFSNHEIDTQFRAVCEQIDLTIKERIRGQG
jgi:very-short-patch-repair endonuclease